MSTNVRLSSMDEVNWLSDEESAAWRGLILMHQLLFAQVERDLLAEADLSGADYAVLVTLSEDSAHQVRMTHLAERMTWSKSRLSHQVARMEKRGLVERKTCGEDARGQWLTLTKNGLKTIQSAAPAHVESVRRHLLASLTPEQVTALAEVSNAVIRNLQENTDLCDGIGEDSSSDSPST